MTFENKKRVNLELCVENILWKCYNVNKKNLILIGGNKNV